MQSCITFPLKYLRSWLESGTNEDIMPFELEAKKSRACQHMVAPLTFNKITQLHSILQTKWEVVCGKTLRQTFEYPNFMECMVFVNDVAALAEEMGHHPDISISCDSVTIELSTTAIGALSEKDFLLARRIEHIM